MPELTSDAVADAARYLDSWLAFRQRHDRIPGVQAALLHDDEVVLSVAHGLADVESATPLTPRHRFRIASHSKTFTATVVVRLAELGALRLDDPLSRWLDEVAGSPLQSITLRELLAHGGGVVRDGWDGDFWQLFREFPDAATLRQVATDDAAVLARNQRFKYSNVGYSLLGQVIEQVTGRPYGDHVRSAIIAPLGLSETTVDIDRSHVADHATGYTSLAHAERRLPIDHIAAGAMASATGFSSTATDLVRYAAAHFHGDARLLSDDGKRQMQRTEWTIEGSTNSYGLGLAIAELGGRRVLGHGGGFPGFITQTWFDPVDRLAVSVLTNAIDGPAQKLADAAIRLVGLAHAPPDDGVDTATDRRRFCGRFANLWTVVDVVDLGGRLYLLDPRADDPTAEPQQLRTVDDRTLRIATAPGYASPGELLVYDWAADGTVRSVRGGSGSTSYPFDAVAAAIAGRDRISLGDPLRPPSVTLDTPS